MRRFVTAIFLALLAACDGISARSLPPIAANLPPDVRDAEREFGRRIRVAFPVGRTESEAVAKLKADGFVVSPLGSGKGFNPKHKSGPKQKGKRVRPDQAKLMARALPLLWGKLHNGRSVFGAASTMMFGWAIATIA